MLSRSGPGITSSSVQIFQIRLVWILLRCVRLGFGHMVLLDDFKDSARRSRGSELAGAGVDANIDQASRAGQAGLRRSEERRGGKGWGRTVRSRWSPAP